jgi:alkylation response protein AidB-like acyl-CoA dehydrogenase
MPNIYGLTPTAEAFATKAASLSRDVLARHAPDVDSRGRFPKESVAALAEQGLYGLCVPTSLGGGAQGPRTFAAVVEELAGGCASTAMVYVMHVAAQQAIASSQTLVPRDDLLRDIARGKHLTTLALSERGSRSQFWAPVSRLAERDGGFVTDAEKSWVTSAQHADSYVSSAQKPSAASPLESTVYMVRRSDRGVRVTGTFEGLGLRGNDSAPVKLENVVVKRGDLISPLGDGAKTMLEVILPWFNIGTAAMANGLCRAAVAVTSQHLIETGFEHTGQRLRDLPNLRSRLAEMSVKTEQARALLNTTLGEMENPSETTPLFVLQTRLASLQAAVDVTDLAMKTCGGAAFSRQLPVERFFRDARAGWVMAPTVDHLNDFVGKALTGLPLF